MDIDQINFDDPQFMAVFETCLKMEIATLNGKLDANVTEIKRQKGMLRAELDKRKQLKEKVAQMERVKAILNDALSKIHQNVSEVSDSLEMMKANADDQYKLIQLRRQEYQNIIAEYKQTWESYRDMYESFPLAKARNAARIELEKLKIEYMVMTYSKTELMVFIEQKRHIDWIRTRCKIVEFAAVMVERKKLEEKLTELKVNVNYRRRELRSIEVELQVMRKRDEDQKILRKQKMLEMAPPKINIPFRGIYRNQAYKGVQNQWKQVHASTSCDDNISVNTLALEELCINSTVSPEVIDIEAEEDNDPKLTAVGETGNFPNSKNAVAPEVAKARAASVASDVDASVEKAVLTDNDVEMKETHEEETQKSHETVKAQPDFHTIEKPLKHSAPKNTQNEIEAKRIRLQSEDGDSNGSSNKITVPQSPAIEEVDLRSPPPRSLPKIQKIETVHYNIVPITPTKPAPPIQRANSSIFSPTHYEYCDSSISFDQDFMSRGGPPSLYDGSLCNYKISPNISLAPKRYVDEDAQMASTPNSSVQQDNKDKDQSDDKTTSFLFNNFTRKIKSDFSLF